MTVDEMSVPFLHFHIHTHTPPPSSSSLLILYLYPLLYGLKGEKLYEMKKIFTTIFVLVIILLLQPSSELKNVQKILYRFSLWD
jgi:hypothetical protein